MNDRLKGETLTESKNEKARPPTPRFIKDSAQGEQGEGWFAGDEAGADGRLPVVVFVPGLGAPASGFWGENELYGVNDLYNSARSEGFRTAFASLNPPDGKARDMWSNGKALARMLSQICRYFKARNVIMACHSKGGVDAQTAAVYYGAAPMIHRIITLSSPHWGSQLADLAYSSAGWPFAELVKAHSDGCYVMQTGYMRRFRHMTDADPQNMTPVDTFAGNGGGPALSKIWAGERYLSRYGENDGVVTVTSAHNPRGRHLATLRLNHVQMQSGKFIWPYLRPAILGMPVPVSPQPQKVVQPLPVGMIFRGGGMEKGVDERFEVDSAAESLEVCVMAAGRTGGKIPGFSIYDPAGRVHKDFSEQENEDAQEHRMCLTFQEPQAGNWKIKAGKFDGAYFAVVRFHGSFSEYPQKDSKGNVKNLRSFLRVLRTYPDHSELICEREAGNGNEAVQLPAGCYSVETSVSGELPDGSPFERNAIRQVLIKRNE